MIVAIDFDGVLVRDRFPNIGEPNWDIVSLVWRLKYTDHELILWTSRVGDRLDEALRWCREHDLRFIAVNDNAPSNIEEYGTNPRKVYADIYIDDRSAGYNRTEAIEKLEYLIRLEETK